ncbi:hypothetical protein V1478_008841 [Vespula squamosa]|uniref:Uncharacterized protein n=1 Tax=Vespula squamosa TaxID=30214 RepID=A0ABD2AUQ8_VESSQ
MYVWNEERSVSDEYALTYASSNCKYGSRTVIMEFSRISWQDITSIREDRRLWVGNEKPRQKEHRILPKYCCHGNGGLRGMLELDQGSGGTPLLACTRCS